MSRGFVKDGDQEEVPVVTPRAFLPKGVQNYVTPEGLKALQDEKAALINERDTLTGNETDRRITYNYLNAKLELLEERIKTAVLVKDTPKETVGFGSYVTIQISGSAANTHAANHSAATAKAPAKATASSVQSLRITGADEADATRGFISHFSPLAKALLGHRRGEGLVLTLPSGPQNITILSVSPSPAATTVADSTTSVIDAPASSVVATPVAPVPTADSLQSAADDEKLTSALARNAFLSSATAFSSPAHPSDSPADTPFADTPSDASLLQEGRELLEKRKAFGPPAFPKGIRASGNESFSLSNDSRSASSSPTDSQPAEKFAPQAQDDPNEIFPLVNDRGITVGRAPRWQCHSGTKLLHPVVHLHVFNSKGEIYLQKRPAWKDIQPGKWDTAVGGHMKFGETPETALKREVEEELGITDFQPKFLKRYIFESEREKELVHIYTTIYDGPITPSAELDGGRFFTREEIKTLKSQKLLTPNFANEYPLLPTILPK